MLLFIIKIYYKIQLHRYNLGNWTIEYGRGRFQAGLTNFNDNKIVFSKLWLKRATFKEAKELFFHEISHILAGADHGHDEVWRRIYFSLSGSDCVEVPNKIKDSDYTYECYCSCGFTQLYFIKSRVYCPECGDSVHYENMSMK